VRMGNARMRSTVTKQREPRAGTPRGAGDVPPLRASDVSTHSSTPGIRHPQPRQLWRAEERRHEKLMDPFTHALSHDGWAICRCALARWLRDNLPDHSIASPKETG
jgi:hypothetical protein